MSSQSRRGGLRGGRREGPGQRQGQGGPDRRGGGLGAQGQLTKRQKEAIADAQRQKNLQRDAMQRQQRLQDEMNRQIEARRLQKLEEQRQQRLQDEMNRQIEARRLQAQQEADLAAQKAAAQEADLAAQKAAAQEAMGPQALGTIVPEGERYSAKTAFEEVMAKNPNIDFMGATPETVKRDIFGNIYTEDDQRLGSMGQLSDVGKLGTVGGIATSALNFMGVPLDTPTFTANPAYQREMAREMGGYDRRALEEGIPAVAKDVSPLSTPLADTIPTADIVNPETGAIDYSSAMASSPVLTTPAASPAAMTPITAQGTPYRLRDYYAGILGQNPAMYAANGGRIGFQDGGVTSFQEALTPQGQSVFNQLIDTGMNEQQAQQRIMEMIQSGSYDLGNLGLMDHFAMATGGRVGKMHGGMMIMGDDGVVNNGIGGILSKYKEIRSEL